MGPITKHVMFASILLAIFLATLLTGCIAPIEKMIDRYNEEITYTYSLKITVQDEGDYSLTVPIPVYQNSQELVVSEMIDELRVVDGHCSYKQIETDRGPALEVKFQNTFLLKVSKKALARDIDLWRYEFSRLSMQNETAVSAQKNNEYIPYDVKCTGLAENQTIEMDLYAFCGSELEWTQVEIVDTIARNQWQRVYGSKERVKD